jgi:hypothetical protein
MRNAYRALLRLYPRDFRALFASEMQRAFEIAYQEERVHPVHECLGLVKGAIREWIAKLTTDGAIRGRTLPDRLLMRPPGVSWEAHYAGAFPEEVLEAQHHTEYLVSRIVHAIANHRWQDARFYDLEERKARENLRLLRQKYDIAE